MLTIVGRLFRDFRDAIFLERLWVEDFFVLGPICLIVNNSKSLTPGHSQQASHIHRSCAEGLCGKQTECSHTDFRHFAEGGPASVNHLLFWPPGGLGEWKTQQPNKQTSWVLDLKGCSVDISHPPACVWCDGPFLHEHWDHDKHTTLTYRPHKGQERGLKKLNSV